MGFPLICEAIHGSMPWVSYPADAVAFFSRSAKTRLTQSASSKTRNKKQVHYRARHRMFLKPGKYSVLIPGFVRVDVPTQTTHVRSSCQHGQAALFTSPKQRVHARKSTFDVNPGLAKRLHPPISVWPNASATHASGHGHRKVAWLGFPGTECCK